MTLHGLISLELLRKWEDYWNFLAINLVPSSVRNPVLN